jgi:2-C-methyl-D-erythritol 4-phosphate cytidylyltransferase
VKWAALIVAAGRGSRFGRAKQLVELAGLPMAGWSMRAFASMKEIAEIVVAAEPESIEPMEALLESLAAMLPRRVVRGGATRQESVYRGLSAISDECDGVLVHDGARPLVSVHDVRAGMRRVAKGRATLLATPVIDTIKAVDPQSLRVVATVDRRALWAAQTPQFAFAADLREAHERARRDGVEATDDATLLERSGVEVVVVPCAHENFKVTLPMDVARAEAILQERVI